MTNSQKHTWNNKRRHPDPKCDVRYVDDENGDEICTLYGESDENKTRSRLIAAAPELLEACKVALFELQGINNGPECKQLSQAIAKAEGRQ